MTLSEQVSELLLETPSYIHWGQILHFLKQHENQLSQTDKDKLRSVIRMYVDQHNQNNPNDVITSKDLNPRVL